MNSNFLIVFFYLLIIGSAMNAQDLHFSQYYRTPLLLNPANTGGNDKDIRLMVIGRNQWETVPVSYNSFGFSGDINIPFKMNRDKIGVGLQVLRDQAGDARYTTFQSSLSGAYHLTTAGMNYFILSIGGSVNYYQRSYDPNKLTFDNQFNGDYFDPSIPINEQFDKLSLRFLDFGLGINYQQTIMFRHVVNLGASQQHIASKQQNFLNVSQNTLLQPKYNLYANAEFMVYKNVIGIIPLLFYQYQDKKEELVLGQGISINLNPQVEEKNKLKMGCSFRIGDAIIPWMQWDFGDISIQGSYDANTSPLRIATNSYGGTELSIGYLIGYRKERERQHDFCPYIWF
jgi:type IX secretion system PorP/SprF family membrane protein